MIKIGDFYDVVAVDANDEAISILNRYGVELLIPINWSLDCENIEVAGLFGDVGTAESLDLLKGILLEDVTRIEIQKDIHYEDPDGKRHLRHLYVDTEDMPTLEWELFCEGEAA